MARKRHSDEDCLRLLREIEVHLSGGSDVGTACRAVGISDATYYTWRKKFGGMGRPQLAELKALQRENQRACGRSMANTMLDPTGGAFESPTGLIRTGLALRCATE